MPDIAPVRPITPPPRIRKTDESTGERRRQTPSPPSPPSREGDDDQADTDLGRHIDELA